MSRRKILVADDDRVIQHIFARLLDSWGYEPVIVTQGDQIVQAFSEHNPALMLLDWEMPELSGVEACRAIRELDIEQQPFVVLVSSYSNPSHLATALNLGANDFLSKPVNPSVLKARIAAGIRTYELQESLLKAHKKLEYQAAHDGLTGLSNRRSILQRMRAESLRAQKTGENLALAICDIDHFKRINDIYGHPVGDRILVEFSRRMEQCFRPYDLLGRWGGEEFIIALSTPDSDPIQFFERFRRSIADEPFLKADLGLNITVSLGVVHYHPSQLGEDPKVDLLIQAADEALYEAKGAGRNRVHSAYHRISSAL